MNSIGFKFEPGKYYLGMAFFPAWEKDGREGTGIVYCYRTESTRTWHIGAMAAWNDGTASYTNGDEQGEYLKPPVNGKAAPESEAKRAFEVWLEGAGKMSSPEHVTILWLRGDMLRAQAIFRKAQAEGKLDGLQKGFEPRSTVSHAH